MTTAEPERTEPGHVDRVVAAMPPPTPEQAGRLMAYFPARARAQQHSNKRPA